MPNFYYLTRLIGVVTVSFSASCVWGSDLSVAINDFNEGRLSTAKAAFESETSVPANKNDALYYLGRIAFEEEEPEKAKEYLSQSIELEPNSSDEYYWLGRAYGELALHANILKQASYVNSVHKYFQLAVDTDPKNIMAQRGLFEFYMIAPSIMGGSLEKAEQIIDVLRKLSPVDADIKQLSLLGKKGELDKWRAQAALLIASYPQSAEALLNAGLAMRDQKQFAEAIGALETASKIPATRTNKMFVENAAYHFSETCQWANVRLDDAIDNLEKLIAQKAGDKKFNKNWPVWTLAKLYKQKGNNAKYKSLRAQLDPGFIKQDKWMRAEVEKADKE